MRSKMNKEKAGNKTKQVGDVIQKHASALRTTFFIRILIRQQPQAIVRMTQTAILITKMIRMHTFPIGFNTETIGFGLQTVIFHISQHIWIQSIQPASLDPIGFDTNPIGFETDPIGFNANPIGFNIPTIRSKAQKVRWNAVPTGSINDPIGKASHPIGHETHPVLFICKAIIRDVETTVSATDPSFFMTEPLVVQKNRWRCVAGLVQQPTTRNTTFEGVTSWLNQFAF